MKLKLSSLLLPGASALLLSACGGSQGPAADTANGATIKPAPLAASAAKLELAGFELAQTHVMPEQGLSWKNSEGEEIGQLHLTGGRDTLVMLSFKNREPVQNPKLEVWLNQQKQTEIALKLPKDLPPTEDQGAPYGRDLYHALVPANYVKPGMSLRVVADNLGASAERKPL